ncbi:MAG: hypothetical protein ACJAXJ_003867 [Colwellia sp.]|jgi:hypothetical protein|tara:strand:- start:5928 stop:6680 length:753 start_codon:yes stop_codon:yes gene_type:complete
MKTPISANTSPSLNVDSRPTESWYKKYIEVIIAGVIGTFLIGIVSWTFGNFATKIDNIEKIISAHHGPQWEEASGVLSVVKLRSEFVQAKNEYSIKLKLLDKKLSDSLENNKKLIKALRYWTMQADKVVTASRERQYEAYAHLTTSAPSNKDVALLNTAHIGGTRFNAGDRVVITNTSSGKREKTTVTITSAYTDLENTDVLIQIAEQPAKILGLSLILGRIKVIVQKEKPDENDPKRWKKINEIINDDQ